MSKVDIETLVYKKPNLNLGLDMLGRVRYGADPVGNEDDEPEEPLPLNPGSPDPVITEEPKDGSGNTGIGGQ